MELKQESLTSFPYLDKKMNQKKLKTVNFMEYATCNGSKRSGYNEIYFTYWYCYPYSIILRYNHIFIEIIRSSYASSYFYINTYLLRKCSFIKEKSYQGISLPIIFITRKTICVRKFLCTIITRTKSFRKIVFEIGHFTNG